MAGVLFAVLVEPKAEPAPGEAGLVQAADTTLGDALRAGDKSAARKLLALQFSYTDEAGAVHARKEFLADLKSAAAAPATDIKVAVYGTVGVVTGHQKSAPDGDKLLLHIWAKQKGAWRILTMQDVGLGANVEVPGEPEVPGVQASAYACKNPCQAFPYRVRSPAEQDVVNAFQAAQKARAGHDAEEWGKHIADEFVHYRSGYAPMSKSSRIAEIEDQKEQKSPRGAERHPDHAAMGIRRRRGDDLDRRRGRRVGAAVARRPRLGEAQRSMADGAQRADGDQKPAAAVSQIDL